MTMPGVSSTSAPRWRKRAIRAVDMLSGIVSRSRQEQEPVAAARGGEGQADAGGGMARHQLGCSRRQPETQAATT